MPVQVSSLTDATAIAAGDEHSLALRGDGTVWAWGNGGDGQLGNGEFDSQSVPGQVLGPEEEFLDLLSLSIQLPGSTVEGTGLLQGAASVHLENPPPVDVEVSLTSDRPGDVAIPGTVTIFAGQTSAVFDLTIGDDALLDGPQWVHITASAQAYGHSVASIEVRDDETATVSLDVPAAASEGDTEEPLQGTVFLSAPPDGDIVIYLSSSDPSVALVPNTAVISAGQTSSTFPITVVDDLVIEGFQTVTITVSVPGWTSGEGTLVVEDNEPMVLSVGLPGSAGERAGVLTGRGTVSTYYPLAYDLVVNLSTDDPTELMVPSLVVIPAGQPLASFDVTVMDDGQIDGTQTATVTASSTGWTSGTASMSVIDNDDYTPRVSVASGVSHGLALGDGGITWAWGSNYYGQLGDGTGTTRSFPVQVIDLQGALAISGGSSHSLALAYDGTVWAWGYNGYGQLGDGTTSWRYTPVQVVDLSDIVAVAAGGSHSLALKEDGTLWAWGNNSYGKLGDGTTTNRYTPVQVANLTQIIAVAAGNNHSLAIKEDGTVWAWGYNGYGQLGDGTTTNRYTPVQVANLTQIIAVATGATHSLAVREDGTVWAWGNNSRGQLGDGSTLYRYTPVQVNDLDNVILIAAGFYSSHALKEDGTVWGWGFNDYGQLGDGTTAQRYGPVQTANLSHVIAISANGYSSLALQEDGSVWAWVF